MAFEELPGIAARRAEHLQHIRAPEVARLPLPDEVLAAMAWEAKQAVAVQLHLAADAFDVQVEPSRPHLVFQLIAADPRRMRELLREYEDDLRESLNQIIRDQTRHPYSAAIRVIGRTEPIPLPDHASHGAAG
jgi:hypothetical protein